MPVDAPNIAGLISLNQCVMEYIDQSNQDISKFRRLYPIAVRGMLELGTDVFFYPKEEKFTLENNNILKFPSDCIRVVAVGILNNQGEFTSLIENRNLTSYAALSNSRASDNKDTSIFYMDFVLRQLLFNYNFMIPDNLYGVSVGSRNFGEYKVDELKRLILFNDTYSHGYCILKYFATPTEDDLMVPSDCREAMIAWIGWQDVAYGNPQLSLVRRKEYYNLKRLASMRIDPMNVDSLVDSTRRSVRLTPKA